MRISITKTSFSISSVVFLLILACGTAFSAEINVEAEKLWDFANGLFSRGKAFYPEAEKQYTEFLKSFPESEHTETGLYRLGECYRLQGKNEKAYETYIKQRTRFPESKIREKVAFRTGQMLYLLDKPADAVKEFGPLYKKELEGELKEMTAFYYGRALIDSGRDNEGINVLSPLASDENGRFRVFSSYHIASSAMKANDNNKAIEHFKIVAESESSLAPESLFRLAELHLLTKKLEEGCKYHVELISKFPGSPYVPYAAHGIIWSRSAAGQHDKCIEAYEKYSKLLSGKVKPEILYLVGNCHYEKKQYENAIGFYLNIPKLFKDSPYVDKARYKTCWSLFLKKDYEQAIAYGGNYLKNKPDAEDADKLRFLVGESELALKNFERARAQFAKVIKDAPGSIFYKNSLFKLAWCQFQQKDYALAGNNFRLFAGKFPEHERAPEALVRAADCSISLSKTEKARRDELLQEAAKDYEAFLSGYRESKSREEVLFQLAVLYIDINDSDSVIKTFQTLVQEFPDGKHSSDAHYWIAREYQKKKDYAQAIISLDKAISSSTPGKFRERAQYQLASIYHEQEEFDKAAAVLVPLITKNPEFNLPQKTHVWAADYLRDKGKLDDAIGIYQQFLKKHTESELNEAVYFGTGECYYAKSDWNLAIENYRKAVEMKGPSLRSAKISLGVSYARAGKYADARPILTEMSKSHDPEIDAKALFWLGNMLLEEAKKEENREAQLEKLNEARLIYLRIDILYINSEYRAESLYRVAETFELSGDSEEASKQYRRVVDEFPETEFGKNAKEKLDSNKS